MRAERRRTSLVGSGNEWGFRRSSFFPAHSFLWLPSFFGSAARVYSCVVYSTVQCVDVFYTAIAAAAAAAVVGLSSARTRWTTSYVIQLKTGGYRQADRAGRLEEIIADISIYLAYLLTRMSKLISLCFPLPPFHLLSRSFDFPVPPPHPFIYLFIATTITYSPLLSYSEEANAICRHAGIPAGCLRPWTRKFDFIRICTTCTSADRLLPSVTHDKSTPKRHFHFESIVGQ